MASQAVQKAENPLTTLNALLTKYKANIAMALPKHITPERMIRVALTAVSQSPKLQLCDPFTVCGAIVQASILGLEPNAVLGEAFLVPYKNNKRKDASGRTGVYECQLQVGYKGHVKLARNSGEIAMVDAQLVYANDTFDFEKGAEPWLKHTWPKTGDRGEVIGCWAGFRLKDGTFNFEFMTAAEIEAHRDRYCKSRDYNTKEVEGPWIDSPEWMWKKTPLIKVLKLAPKSVQMAQAITLTEQSEASTQQKFSVDVPIELHAPEVVTEEPAEKAAVVSMPQRKSATAPKDAPPAESAPEVREVAELPDPLSVEDTLLKCKGKLFQRNDENTAWREIK